MRLARPRRGIAASQYALLGLLAVWALAPLIVMIVHALRFHVRLTGADGLVGGDQLQYLAWVRDSASHFLAGNLFTFPPGPQSYLHPLFTISGVLTWLGVPLPLAYWVWKPVAVAVLFGGAAWWTGRLLRARHGRRAAGLALALFLFTPAASVAGWATIGSGSSPDHLLQIAAEMFPAAALWGYLPAALAVGLMPVALLASERASAAHGPPRRRWLSWAAAATLLIAWLHPWQALVLGVMLVAVMAWGRGSDARVLGVPVLASAVPLAYYLLLSRLDPAWKLASNNELVVRPPLSALLLALAPLAPFALAGLRRPGDDLAERFLLAWIPASLSVYFIFDSYPTHALESLSLPLAVLCVRGWRRLRLPTALGVGAVALATLPGVAYEARAFRNIERGPIQQYYLNASDARALDWISAHAPPGGVLARTIVAVGVPSQTDRAVWVGHEFWSRDYVARTNAADALFAGTLSAAQAQPLVRLSGARLVLADCGAPVDLGAVLGPVLASVHRFGCARVGVVAP